MTSVGLESYTQYAQMLGTAPKQGDGPEELQKAAQHFESLFIDLWLKSARKAEQALAENNPLNTEEMRMRRDMLDHEMAIHMAANGGIGLAPVIVRQLSGDVAMNRAATPDTIITLPSGEALSTKRFGQRVEAFPDRDAFIEQIKPIAEKLTANTAIPPQLAIGQAALETGWGSEVIADADGKLSHNLFGMKASAQDDAAVEIASSEFLQGQWQQLKSRFKAYTGWAESITDYVAQLTSNPRYAAVVKADSLEGKLAALQEAGYATDPNYASKISRIIGGL